MGTQKNVAAIFDIGKTNKKLLLFDTDYKLIYELTTQLEETFDDDGDPCEDLSQLIRWITESLSFATSRYDFDVKAINVATYGASLIHLNDETNPVGPLYSYLKPYPDQLLEPLYQKYGGVAAFALQTNSPALKSLNSGLQLYRLKCTKPEMYDSIKLSLHLPQYISLHLGGQTCSDITSIGCHTALWDSKNHDYHQWVHDEKLNLKFAPILPCSNVTWTCLNKKSVAVGVGLHDSSSALIPYILNFTEPFVLISTGTWSISLNPFNVSPLTAEELSKDCLTYFNHQGAPVKASRLFLGCLHDTGAQRIAEHFHVSGDFFKRICYSPDIIKKLRLAIINARGSSKTFSSTFSDQNLSEFKTIEEAYHAFMLDLVKKQSQSTTLIFSNTIKIQTIFVDGGFCNNEIFMNLLSEQFKDMKVYAASLPQATAIGAAMCIHNAWNNNPEARNMIELKSYEYH